MSTCLYDLFLGRHRGVVVPINIYEDETMQEVAFLCRESWVLALQIEELEEWLVANENVLPPRNYVADVGFDIRKDACGGGAVLSIKAMSIMVKLGVQLYLSEYPNSLDQ